MKKEVKPLWRKLSKPKSYKTHDIKVGASYDRGKKEGIQRSMHGSDKGKDYTPLYKYLQAQVGRDFDEVCSEIYPRIDDRDRIWDIVEEQKPQPSYRLTGRDYTNNGSNSYYSKLIIDENNKLQFKNPNLKIEDFYPSCDCCTHSFNGKPFINKWVYGKDLLSTYPT